MAKNLWRSAAAALLVFANPASANMPKDPVATAASPADPVFGQDVKESTMTPYRVDGFTIHPEIVACAYQKPVTIIASLEYRDMTFGMDYALDLGSGNSGKVAIQGVKWKLLVRQDVMAELSANKQILARIIKTAQDVWKPAEKFCQPSYPGTTPVSAPQTDPSIPLQLDPPQPDSMQKLLTPTFR